MSNKNFDGRTASFKVTEVSGLTSEMSTRYFSNLEDAKNYMYSDINRKSADFRFGSDFHLLRKSGNTWVHMERLGKHFV